MKKVMAIIGIMLLVFVLVGCGQEAAPKSVPRAVKDSGGAVTEEAASEESASEEAAAETVVETSVGVTQEELDELEAALEELDVEDLGGFSE